MMYLHLKSEVKFINCKAITEKFDMKDKIAHRNING